MLGARPVGPTGAKIKGRRQDPSWPAARTSGPYVTAQDRSQARRAVGCADASLPILRPTVNKIETTAKSITDLLSVTACQVLVSTRLVSPIFCWNA